MIDPKQIQVTCSLDIFDTLRTSNAIDNAIVEDLEKTIEALLNYIYYTHDSFLSSKDKHVINLVEGLNKYINNSRISCRVEIINGNVKVKLHINKI